MKKDVLVSVYTQVYNAKPYLPRCVESVLKQTLQNFEYILIDNGSTDGSWELLEQFAKRDNRIHLVRFEENIRAPRWIQTAKEIGSGKYIANLDSDDWLEETFLEKLAAMAEESALDIVCTGTTFRQEGEENKSTGVRGIKQRLIWGQGEMAELFPYYHVFFRPTWAKLIRRDLFQRTDYLKVQAMTERKVFNGADTITSFAWLRTAKRVGIDDSVLHNYLIRSGSVYHNYSPTRFQSVTILYDDAVHFLSRFGTVSQENQTFLAIVYANGLLDALAVLQESSLTAEEKLRECCTAAEHPITKKAFTYQNAAIEQCRDLLVDLVLSSGSTLKKENTDFTRALQALRPKCGCGITTTVFPLFQQEPVLMKALREDDREHFLERLAQLIFEKKYTRQFDIIGILQRVIPNKNPLKTAKDARFYQLYSEDCMLLLHGEYAAALAHMKGELLEKQEMEQKNTFLEIYLSLAALQKEEAALIFGKVCLAKQYLQKEDYENCRLLLDELKQMGASEDEELTEIRRELERRGALQEPVKAAEASCAPGADPALLQELLQGLETQRQAILRLEAQTAKLQMTQVQLISAVREIEKGTQKLNTDLFKVGAKLLADVQNIEFWSNEYERNIVRINWGDVSKDTDFAQKFTRLTSGLDAKSVQAIIRILKRQKQYLNSDQDKLNLFTRAEQEELRLLRENFEEEIIDLSDHLFAYRNYLLPIRHFEPNVFYFRYGLDEVCNLDSVKGKAIVDVGGFIGDSVLIFSELGADKIYTFEAVPKNFQLLQQTIALNHVENVIPENLALGAKNGTTVMHVCGAGSTSIERPGNPYEQDITVPVATLDTYVSEHPMEIGLIKVDIEGGEPGFLEGAKETICAQKPILLLSIYHNAHDFFELKPLVESWDLGYRFKIHKPTYGNATSETLLIAEIPKTE